MESKLSYAEKQSWFLVKENWNDWVPTLTDEDAGKIFKALYSSESPEGMVGVFYNSIRDEFDRVNAFRKNAMQETSKKNSENAKKRWGTANAMQPHTEYNTTAMQPHTECNTTAMQPHTEECNTTAMQPHTECNTTAMPLQSIEHRAQSTGYRAQGIEHRAQGIEYTVQVKEERVKSTDTWVEMELNGLKEFV